MCSCLTEFDEKAYRKGIYIEIAIELFRNNVSYELVRKSIQNLSDKQLKELYDEVQAEKN